MTSGSRRTARRVLGLGSVLAAGMLAAACGSPAGSASGSGGASGAGSSSSGSIQVGAEVDVTGSYSTFGAQSLQGVQAGVYAVNAAGGVLSGRKLTIDVADSASDPVDSVPPAHKLVDVNHIAFQDGLAGAEAQAVDSIYTAAKVPFMMPGGDTFYDNNTNPYIWRLSPSDSQLGVAMALWAHHQGYTRAAALFRTGEVAQAIVPVVEKEFKKLGGTITSTQIIQPDLSDYSSEVSKLTAGKPQVIFSEMDPPTEAVVFKNLQAAGVNNLPTIGTDDMVSDSMLKAIGIPTAMKLMTNVEAGVYNSPAAAVFAKAVAGATHKPIQAGAQNTYDGVVIASLAMDAAHSTTGAAVNAEIPKITAPGGTVVYSYAQGKADLAAGKHITYIGASGPSYFDKYHNVFGPFIVVRATPSGKYDTILQFTASQLKAATSG
jgi:ABC-type branched-subunit amino acid transport system substrate-binding protein